MKSFKYIIRVVILFAIISNYINANTYYWMGGDGNWNDPAHWSLSATKPRVAAGSIPTGADDVVVDSLSGDSASFDITLVGNPKCKSLTFPNKDNYSMGIVNNNGAADTLFIGGSLSLLNADNSFFWNFDGVIVFNSNSVNNNIKTNHQEFNGDVIFNGNGSWYVNTANDWLDDIRFYNSNFNLVLKSGTLNLISNSNNVITTCNKIIIEGGSLSTNNANIFAEEFLVIGSSAKTLSFQNSNINLAQRWDATGSSNISISGHYYINIGGYSNTCEFRGNGLNYSNLIIKSGNNVCNLYGTNTFNEIIIQTDINFATYLNFYDNISLHNLVTEGPNTAFLHSNNKTIYDVDGGKSCLKSLNIDSLNAGGIAGTDFVVYNGSFSGSETGWINASGDFPKAGGGIYSNATAICPGSSISLAANYLPALGSFAYQWTAASQIISSLAGVNSYTPTQSINLFKFFIYDIGNPKGCFTTDSLTVNIIGLIPPSAGTDMQICSGDTIHLIANSTPNVTQNYAWTPTNAIVGGSPIGEDYGNYSGVFSVLALPTVTTTYTLQTSFYDFTTFNYCYSYDYVTISMDNNPINSITPTNPKICKGDSIELTAVGSGNHFEWSLGLGTPNLIHGNVFKVSPVTNTNYTIKGCVNTLTVTLTVNSLPNVDAGLNGTVCSGLSYTLTGTGALNYAWFPSTYLSKSLGITTAASPETTTKYYAIGKDANNCKNKDSVIVAVNQASLLGKVTYSGGVVAGNAQTFAKLFKYSFNKSMDLIDSVGLDLNGNYSISNLSMKDTSILYIHPDTAAYKNTVGSYFASTYDWTNATKIIPSCPSTTANITLVETIPANGSGVISGRIFEGQGFSGKRQAAGDGISGVQVGLKKKPGGQLGLMATTDNNGDFSLKNIPDGDYTMYGNIPGLPIITNYTVSVSPTSKTFTSINFEADSNKINASGALSIETISEKAMIQVFPNPAKNSVNIKVESLEREELNIVMFDILGNEVKQASQNIAQRGVNTIQFNTFDLAEGMYFLNIKTKNKTITEKLFIVK